MSHAECVTQLMVNYFQEEFNVLLALLFGFVSNTISMLDNFLERDHTRTIFH